MTPIGQKVVQHIDQSCRKAGVKDAQTCATLVQQKLEAEVIQICDKQTKDLRSDQTCKQKLFNRPEAIQKKLGKGFIEKEVALYKAAEQVPAFAQCMTPIEWRLFKHANAWRDKLADEFQQFGHSKKKAESFKVDCDLVRSAKLHSQDIAQHKPDCVTQKGCNPHIGSNGSTSDQRINEATQDRYFWTTENFATGGAITGLANITSIQDDFINQHPVGQLKTHRANLLDPRFTHLGIGVYISQASGQIFLTQDFGGL